MSLNIALKLLQQHYMLLKMLKIFSTFICFPRKHFHLFYRSFCQSYDMKQHSTKVFRDIVNALGSFIQSLFLVPPTGNPATTNQAGKGIFILYFYILPKFIIFAILRGCFLKILWLETMTTLQINSKDLYSGNLTVTTMFIFFSRIDFLLWYIFSSSNHIRIKA
jgi:hypothetical protein